jgi:hypothetical protein
MIKAVQEDDKKAIEDIQEKLAGQAYVFTIEVKEKSYFGDIEESFVQLDREVTVLLNQEVVYAFNDVHVGYYGGMGAGWFIEETSNNLSQEMMETLSYFDIRWPEINVPRPEQIRKITNIRS